MTSSFLWYDLETFGRDSRWDRIAQFAAIRTDLDFNPISDPIVLYGRISPDYLPDPEACRITRLTPRKTAEGLVEAELASEILAHMATPGTCAVGFNSISFDDEFIRNLLYRNFYDPYRREYDRGNSRWDILPLVRMAHDLRPQGIEWPRDEVGRPVFRLEELTSANGLSHERAHDALSDVEATVAVARMVRERQPKLFEYYLKLRKKNEVRRIINLQNPEPLVYVSPLFSREEGLTSVVYPVTTNPDNGNEIITFDLRYEPDRLWKLETEEIRRLVFTPREALAGEERIPLVGIAVNKVPSVAPLSTLQPEQAHRLGLSLDEIDRRARRLALQLSADPGTAKRIGGVYRREGTPQYRDPDLNIYNGGFFGDEDKKIFNWIHVTPPEELLKTPPKFADPRGHEMLWRYVARNWPDVLNTEEERRWRSHCAGRLLAPEYRGAKDVVTYKRDLRNIMSRSDISPQDKRIYRDLLEYTTWLERNVLEKE